MTKDAYQKLSSLLLPSLALVYFGGATKSEAVKVLREVKSRYPDANIRRMRVIKSIT